MLPAPAQGNASHKMGVDAEPGKAECAWVGQGGGERGRGARLRVRIWLWTGAGHPVQWPDAALANLDPLSLVEIF